MAKIVSSTNVTIRSLEYVQQCHIDRLEKFHQKPEGRKKLEKDEFWVEDTLDEMTAARYSLSQASKRAHRVREG